MEILFTPTMRCQLKCRHCFFDVTKGEGGAYSFTGYGSNHVIDKELTWQEWLSAFDHFKQYRLEISGGEPLLYVGIKDLLNNLPKKQARWSLTSNTLLNVEGIDFSKCEHWTASWHKVNMEQFSKNLKYLKGRGVDLSVSVVVEQTDFDGCVAAARSFKHAGYKVNVLPELGEFVNWNKGTEWDEIQKLRQEGFNVVSCNPKQYEFSSGYTCLAGSRLIAAFPNGDAYRCYSQSMLGKPLGKVADVQEGDVIRECRDTCLACEIDHKYRIRKLKGVLP